jgi:hypothetical protein
MGCTSCTEPQCLYKGALYLLLSITVHKIIVLPICLSGYETWSHTLGEERRRRVLAGRVQRSIFVTKGQKVLAGRRIVHIEELNPLNTELNPICQLYK